MDKKAKLESLRREHARDRAEIRDDEWFIRDGEDQRIGTIREKMARILDDAEIEPEKRKETLAALKEEIELILDARDEREHNFIEQELRRHQLEQELEQQIAEEERPKGSAQANQNNLNFLFRARSSLNAGAEQLRKNIEENRKELNEDEQFSTILINSSERENIPNFTSSRRKKREREPAPEQTARIDTIVIKQREIGLMYRESQEQQNSQLRKTANFVKRIEEPKPEESEEPDEFDETTETGESEAS